MDTRCTNRNESVSCIPRKNQLEHIHFKGMLLFKWYALSKALALSQVSQGALGTLLHALYSGTHLCSLSLH